MSCHFLLQGIFLIQELNPLLLHLPHWQGVVYHCATWGGRGKKTSLFPYFFPFIRKNAFLRNLFLIFQWATRGVRPTPTLFNEKGNFHDLFLGSFYPPRDDHLWFIPWCWHDALNTVGIRIARKKSQWLRGGYLTGATLPTGQLWLLLRGLIFLSPYLSLWGSIHLMPRGVVVK